MIFASTLMASKVLPTMILDLGLMTLLVVVAFAIVRMRSLFGIVMLQGVYSLVCAAWFVSLDAVDVAFTEAAVGAGVSTVLMLAAMLLADNGNAGHWRASPNGQRLSAPAAPAANVTHEEQEDIEAAEAALKKLKPVVASRKKPTTKKTTPKKTKPKKATSSSPAPKKRGRPKGSKNKPKAGDV